MSGINDNGDGSSFFPDVPTITYDPNNATALSFRHYNPTEIILGKPMKEWLRFSVCFWHTFGGGGGSDPFGAATLKRPWEKGGDDDTPMKLAKRRIDVSTTYCFCLQSRTRLQATAY